MHWKRAAVMVPIPGRKGDPPMWRFPLWRDDGLELVPIYAEIGTGFVRWELRFLGEVLGTCTGWALVALAQADEMQPLPCVTPAVAYAQLLR